jgi:hypothetical protein
VAFRSGAEASHPENNAQYCSIRNQIWDSTVKLFLKTFNVFGSDRNSIGIFHIINPGVNRRNTLRCEAMDGAGYVGILERTVWKAAGALHQSAY